jgi:Fis family transcriptional regulator, factor for inversion stimulation protein
MSKKRIEEGIRQSLDEYFKDLGDEQAHGLYDMVLHIVEKPVLEVVMQRAGGNQSKAAQWLGLNRNTLRKKLGEHEMLPGADQ